jgi:hypothetical protein
MLPVLFATLIFGVSSGYPAMLGTNVSKDGGYSYQIAPNQHTPVELKEAWLRCHEDKVCQKVDAEFEFPNEKMVVWVNVEKEKDSRKLLELLRPLMDSRQIELHPVHIGIKGGFADIKTPPPSFWTNTELIEHFQDSYLPDAGISNEGRLYNATIRTHSMMYEQRIPMPTWGLRPETPTSSILFGQRLLMFAQDTLKNDRNMSRYAANLPALARVAFDSAETPALSLRALAVCREYAQELQKYEKKLKDNLSIALPSTLRNGHKTTPIEKTTITKETAIDFAAQLAREIQDLSNSVYQFMYPDNHTVALTDLRDPSLIQSLETVQRDTAEFLNFIH